MNTLDTIKQIVLPRREIIFDDPVVIKKTPHEHVFACYGVHAEENGVWLMDGAGKWHELEETDNNATLVIRSLYQRLRILELEMA